MSGIIFMISRKFALLANIENEKLPEEDFFFEVPDIETIKDFLNKKVKKLGYLIIVLGMRLYFRGAEFSKRKYSQVRDIIRDTVNKNKVNFGKFNKIEEKTENQFLKTMSEYKKKIHRIKKKVKEEEGIK